MKRAREAPLNLNVAQKAAVKDDSKLLLLLAGAGTGKTECIAQRVAYRIQFEGLDPSRCMMVTFTNKAAHELRARVKKIVGDGAEADKSPNTPSTDASVVENGIGDVWCGTFHAMAHNILRSSSEAHPRWWNSGLTIIDADEQRAVIESIIETKTTDVGGASIKLCDCLTYISSLKRKEKRAPPIESVLNSPPMIRVYSEYQSLLYKLNLVDFDDLMLRCVLMLRACRAVRHRWQRYFMEIYVDEFQDVDQLQEHWLRLLCRIKPPESVSNAERQKISLRQCARLTVVGDDDQSIYSFRGARPSIFVDWLQERIGSDWEASSATTDNLSEPRNRSRYGVNVIALVKNYRSSRRILMAANSLIQHNRKRVVKSLTCSRPHEGGAEHFPVPDETCQNHLIVDHLKLFLMNGEEPGDIAVLSRTNASLCALRPLLEAAKIPFKIYGRPSFLDRDGVRDVLAYVRYLQNPVDVLALRRIISRPSGGIDKTLLLRLTREEGVLLPLTRILEVAAKGRCGITVGEWRDLQLFAKEMHELQDAARRTDVKTLVDMILGRLGLLESYRAFALNYGKSDKSRRRASGELEAIHELVEMIRTECTDLPSILSSSLKRKESDAKADVSHIQLMTMHASKGREFKTVLVAAVNGDVFPSSRSSCEASVEEMRRLLYVAVTRARDKLRLYSYAVKTGADQWLDQSPFINEMHLAGKSCLTDGVGNTILSVDDEVELICSRAKKARSGCEPYLRRL